MDGCWSSGREHSLCHAITSRLSPADFQFDVLGCRCFLSYRGRKLPVLDHPALLIESMDNQQNLLLGVGEVGVVMKEVINCCHKRL